MLIDRWLRRRLTPQRDESRCWKVIWEIPVEGTEQRGIMPEGEDESRPCTVKWEIPAEESSPQKERSETMKPTKWKARCYSGGIAVASLIGIVLVPSCTTVQNDFVPTRVQLPGGIVSVPIVLENDCAFVEGMINGHGPYRFLLDTGTGVLILSDRVASDLNLPNTSHTAKGVLPTGAKAAALRVVSVSELSLNTAALGDLCAVVRKLDSFEHIPLECDGILGFQVFKDCLLTIDFPKRRLQLGRGALVRSDNLRIVSTDIVGGTPRIPVLIGLGTEKPIVVKMVVDTGFNGCVALPGEPEAYPFAWEPIRESTFVSGGEVSRNVVGVLRAKMVVGDQVVENPTVCYVNGDGLIGTRILRSYVVTFDQVHRLVRLAFIRA